ncbi:MAG TPA: cytochrome c biogenesis protein CcdA [Planctomycetota bacterium]|jgi:thiol:disulfide interchange protein DsbD
MRSKFGLIGGALGLALLVSLQAACAETRTIAWTLQNTSVDAARGQSICVEVDGIIPAGYHMYSSKSPKEYGNEDLPIFPTSFEIGPKDVLVADGDASYDLPKLMKEPSTGVKIEIFEKKASFAVPVRVKAEAKPGTYLATLTITAQICKDQCVLTTEKLNFTVHVNSGPVAADAPRCARNRAEMQDRTDAVVPQIRAAKQQGLGSFLWVAAGSGLLALLTPCVFPMIPITVSFFTKRKQNTRAAAIRDAGVYSLGIILTYTGLAFLFALVLGASGIINFATSPWVNLAVAAVFLGLAGSLFGWYEFRVPSGILNKLHVHAHSGEGITAVLAMGLVFSLTSLTCTVPFVGAVMVAATEGDWLTPLVGMLVFSGVFAAPFFLLALFPAALKSLPKSGSWLNSVKVLMGFLEVAAAMKFLSNADLVWQWGLLTRNVFLLGWIALAVLAVLYLAGRIRFAHDTPVQRFGRVRVLTIGGFVSVTVFLTGGLMGWNSLRVLEAYVPNYGADRGWIDNFEDGLAAAKRTGKPMFVDFTGYTCTNCRQMEENMFPQPEVAPLLQQFVRVRLHTDGRKDQRQLELSRRNQALQRERFKTMALPFYAIISPADKVVGIFEEGLTTDAAKFAEFLNSGLKPQGTAARVSGL